VVAISEFSGRTRCLPDSGGALARLAVNTRSVLVGTVGAGPPRKNSLRQGGFPRGLPFNTLNELLTVEVGGLCHFHFMQNAVESYFCARTCVDQF